MALDGRSGVGGLAHGAHPRLRRRTFLAATGVAGVATGAVAPDPAVAALLTQSTAGTPAVLVTASATGEDLDPLEPGTPAGGLVLRFTIENQTAGDLSGVRLVAPFPVRSSVAGSWLGAPGQRPGALQAASIVWDGLSIRRGEQLGPFAYRVVPASGADGATIFRDESVRAEVTWSQTGALPAGTASSERLRLNGLWGEGGLRRTVLPTQLTIFTRERPDTATVALQMGVRAGARDEDDTTHGGSHWLEHAFFLGTERRPNNRAIFGPIEAVGGNMNASTSFEYTNYYNTIPAEQFDLGLDVLADQLLHSTFPRDAFDRERQVVAEEIKRAIDNPGGRATREFLKLVFRVSPLRRDVLGPVESVASIPIDIILAYKQRHYVTGNMAFAAIGNLGHDDAVARIARAFAGLPRGNRQPRPDTPEPVQTAPRRLDLGDGSRLAEIRLGWPAPGDNHPDAPAMYMLADILGTTGRRLVEEIRDRRALASSVGIAFADFTDAGALMISAGTQPSRVAEVIDAILEQIRRVRDGDVSEEDVRISRRANAGRRALSDELNEAQANRAALEVAGTLDSFEEYLARLAPVTAADVQRVAQRYLDPVNYTLVVVRS